VDGSVRRDQQTANGTTLEDNAATRTWDPATQKTVNYEVARTSYSVGTNYAIAKRLSVFARASEGVAFSADRLLYGNPLDGTVPIAFNQIQQQEVGVKWRGSGVSAFATLFHARTSESNYEATTQRFTENQYASRGAELEAVWMWRDLRLSGGATWTHARITDSNDASTIGKKPRRQADVVYQLAPSVNLGTLELGVSMVGTGESFGDDANTIILPSFNTVNAFANCQLNPKTTLSWRVNNLFNTLGYTEIEGDGHAARAVNGRSATVQLKYRF
jgi:outer membrane receptor protein involved in Fe transport